MMDEYVVGKLKEKINEKKHKLNNLVTRGLDRDEIIALSQELDLLIVEYCKLDTKTSSI